MRLILGWLFVGLVGSIIAWLFGTGSESSRKSGPVAIIIGGVALFISIIGLTCFWFVAFNLLVLELGILDSDEWRGIGEPLVLGGVSLVFGFLSAWRISRKGAKAVE